MVHEYVRYYTRVNVYIPLKKRIIDNEREREGERERERKKRAKRPVLGAGEAKILFVKSREREKKEDYH